jgi:hypothetical protein
MQTLVSALETQKSRAPSALAFRAAQVVLGAKALFSDKLLRNLLDPPSSAGRAASEVHHLFPQAWLYARGIRERRRVNQVANLADVGWYENTVIGGRGPSDYVPRLRQKLMIDDAQWARMCAEHALPPQWERMEYEEFLLQRRQRMADLIRVAFRQLGGEAEGPPISPPWFPSGAESVWQRITEVERVLRGIVRQAYIRRFGERAAQNIEQGLSEAERTTLSRALRARPADADPISIVDYLYLSQLPALLFKSDVWSDVRQQFRDAQEVKQRIQAALKQIIPVRNEIAHVREVPPDRLLRAAAACSEMLEIVQGS